MAGLLPKTFHRKCHFTNRDFSWWKIDINFGVAGKDRYLKLADAHDARRYDRNHGFVNDWVTKPQGEKAIS